MAEGPIITRGPNIHPAVFEQLVTCAENANIPIQVEADPLTNWNGCKVNSSCEGRNSNWINWNSSKIYAHTYEVIDLDDLESVVELMVVFANSLNKTTKFV